MGVAEKRGLHNSIMLQIQGTWLFSIQVKGYIFFIQELEPESEDDPKETKSHNEEELREKCDYCDALISQSLVVWQLLIAPIAKEEED